MQSRAWLVEASPPDRTTFSAISAFPRCIATFRTSMSSPQWVHYVANFPGLSITDSSAPKSRLNWISSRTRNPPLPPKSQNLSVGTSPTSFNATTLPLLVALHDVNSVYSARGWLVKLIAYHFPPTCVRHSAAKSSSTKLSILDFGKFPQRLRYLSSFLRIH